MYNFNQFFTPKSQCVLDVFLILILIFSLFFI